MPNAIIDLGTNTFHLLIFENQEIIYRNSIAVKLGQGGINQNIITNDAQERALATLSVFKEKITQNAVQHTFAFGTSAIRNASNANEFITLIKLKLDIEITVIDGNKEAELIYLGVKKAVNISENSLIIDIGGGSVEFIIANESKVLWMRSFEMGGQRLIEKYMKKDPISVSEINRMNDYFRESLLPLTNAIHQYSPSVLIGSSGSFDTLNDMLFVKSTGEFAPNSINGFDYPKNEFFNAYEQLVFNDRQNRLAIPGMIELRVDMIVVAVCLIRYVIETYDITNIKISNFALKEGAMSKLNEKSA